MSPENPDTDGCSNEKTSRYISLNWQEEFIYNIKNNPAIPDYLKRYILGIFDIIY